MKTKILADFQICIHVPLKYKNHKTKQCMGNFPSFTKLKLMHYIRIHANFPFELILLYK